MENLDLTPPEVLRDLIKGKGKEKLQKCAICGKPESRNTNKVNEACPTHKRAVLEDWQGKFASLSKILGSNLIDFVQRKKFNAELEWLRAGIEEARKEHDAYQPVEPVSEREQVQAQLNECLALLGSQAPEIPEGGKLDMLALATKVKVALAEACNRTAAVEIPAAE